jgi:hypothetical protein
MAAVYVDDGVNDGPGASILAVTNTAEGLRDANRHETTVSVRRKMRGRPLEAQSRHRCGGGAASPGAYVPSVRRVPPQRPSSIRGSWLFGA